MLIKLIISLLLSITSLSYAVDLELTQGINSALPLGINSFGSNTAAQELEHIINHDLSLTGQFNLIHAGDEPSIGIWRQKGADNVIFGQVRQTGFKRFAVEVKLVDAIVQGRVLLTRDFQINANQLRALAHHISDEIYQKLTGERGIFSTKIAYILVQRRGPTAKYFLEVADIDGYNPQQLLTSSEPIMSPAWSPDARQIAYVSFEKKKAQIYLVEVATGRRRLITNFSGINGAPAWSHDGRELAVVLSKGGSPKIYTVDLATGTMKQLTFGQAIDTEPRYSPDGQSLLFTSGRGGSPQVYKLSLTQSTISRLTYEGNYNARASYTPNQKNLVMLHREDKNFNIAVQDEQGNLTTLTSSSLDESPSVAPNGRLILYATRVNDQGVLGLVSIDGRMKTHLPAREGDVQEPAWSPFL